MKWWIKVGCFLTGWNSAILARCSEASYKHLKKYTSALLILILLWGFTGYCFAERYVGVPWWGCLISAIVFITVIIQIERQIILTVGTNRWNAVFRVFIAIIMAVLGSTIIDQIIFGADISRKMVEITDRQVVEQLPMRLNVIDAKLTELQTSIDSLDKANVVLNNEIVKEPVIKTVSTTTTYTKERQEDGTYKSIPQTTVSTTPVANPRVKQVETNNLNLERLRKQQEDYTQKKMNVEKDLRAELSSNVGFLEELRAILEILSSRTEALIFYVIVFLFLISLELFVVTSKLGDHKCDYDIIVEHQLKVKSHSLQELMKSLEEHK